MAKILVVEDNADMQQIYKDLFKNRYEIVVTGKTSQAERVLMEDRIDIVILDILLPDENGDLFLQRISKSPKFKNLKVIVVTVLGDMTEQLTAVYPNLVCMPKPFDQQKLLELINRMLKFPDSFSPHRSGK